MAFHRACSSSRLNGTSNSSEASAQASGTGGNGEEGNGEEGNGEEGNGEEGKKMGTLGTFGQ